MQYKHLIIDVQNLYWRSVLNTFKNLQNLSEKQEELNINSVIIPETLKRIEQLKERFGEKDCQVYLLFDNPMSGLNRRKSIYQEYKHARDKRVIPPIFYRTLEFLEIILQYYNSNTFILRIDGLEADDLVQPLLEKILEIDKDNNCLLISADLDWSKSITENIHWFNYLQVFDINVFKEKYGFSPKGNKIQLYKAFHGDNSDNIPNAVPYLPKEVLLCLVNKFDSLSELLTSIFIVEECPKQWQIKIKEAEKQLKINYFLADFMKIEDDIRDYMIICEENIKVLKYWFNFLNIPLEAKLFNPTEDNFFEIIK
jgi:5'-3' exonuclease